MDVTQAVHCTGTTAAFGEGSGTGAGADWAGSEISATGWEDLDRLEADWSEAGFRALGTGLAFFINSFDRAPII
jgi:hypothetical protein